jgi:glutathione S-transferase
MIQLYWAPQTRSFRALWILEEAGADYELISVDISQAYRSPEHLRINPMGKVPAMRDGDAELAESAAICAYVAEKYPQAGLAPEIGDPARGRYFHWLFFAPGCIEPAYAQKFANFEMPPRSAAWGDFDRVIATLDEALSKRAWILGDRFSAADVMLGADLYFGIERFGLVQATPALSAYLERCMARPAFQRAMRIDSAPARAA